jgi:translation initiation factor IF-2
MAKKRVHELAREFNLPSEEIRKRLDKAGIKLKAAASAVDEDLAAAAITGKPLPNGNAKKEPQRPGQAEHPRQRVGTPAGAEARRLQERRRQTRRPRRRGSQRRAAAAPDPLQPPG